MPGNDGRSAIEDIEMCSSGSLVSWEFLEGLLIASNFVYSQQDDVLDLLRGYQKTDFIVVVGNAVKHVCRCLQVALSRLKCIHYRFPYGAAIAVIRFAAALW